MKNIWVLTIKSSLTEKRSEYENLKARSIAFENFEKAKEQLCDELRKVAYSENAMFDGKGNIIYLNKYMEERMDEVEDEADVKMCEMMGIINKNIVRDIQQKLLRAFEGESVQLTTKDGTYGDLNLSVTIENNSISFRPEFDGPYNGYNPEFSTNIFSMEEEKDYYFYIVDSFGQDEAPSKLYIDLKKVELIMEK